MNIYEIYYSPATSLIFHLPTTCASLNSPVKVDYAIFYLYPKGTSHGDDLQYLFNDVFGKRELERPDDKFLSEIMLDLWTNFAATG